MGFFFVFLINSSLLFSLVCSLGLMSPQRYYDHDHDLHPGRLLLWNPCRLTSMNDIGHGSWRSIRSSPWSPLLWTDYDMHVAVGDAHVTCASELMTRRTSNCQVGSRAVMSSNTDVTGKLGVKCLPVTFITVTHIFFCFSRGQTRRSRC